MIHLLSELSKYILIFLILLYTYECFHVFRYQSDSGNRRATFHMQRLYLFCIHFIGYLVLFLHTKEIKLCYFYLMQLVLFIGIYVIYHYFYRNASELLLNNMIMLLVISFVILTRISFDQAFRQFEILIGATAVSLLIPFILSKETKFRSLKWLYAVVGILSLAVVLVIGKVSYGAKLSISIAGISVQPSEFVKILFVFFLSSMLSQNNSFKNLLIVSATAAVHVLILVGSKDLGAALLFYVTFLIIIYVATKRKTYLALGSLFLALAAVVGYFVFGHVQIRVSAWLDPLSDIDNKGYQVSQSLFGIGTGGWFGMGLNQGLPKKIPVVEQDFIFAAISEELGGIFAVALILICLSCFFMILNISMQLKDTFYQLVAVGLGTTYGFQVFLTIGGVIKLIPSTGVTLPLVSYGGSSLLASMILFGIIQGLYIKKSDDRYH